jgi:hypothetical protein
MPDKVLIYSRFPKAMMVRIGQRFDLMVPPASRRPRFSPQSSFPGSER